VIADRVQVGFEGTGTLRRWFRAGQLMEIVGRVREIGTDGNGRLTIAKPPICSHDRWEGGDRGKSVVPRVFLTTQAENGRSHAQGIHGRRLHNSRLTKNFDCRTGQRTARGEILREFSALRWLRQSPMQEQVSDFLETGERGQVFHGIPGKCQPPGLAIHVA
jgi:hypothetical protein